MMYRKKVVDTEKNESDSDSSGSDSDSDEKDKENSKVRIILAGKFRLRAVVKLFPGMV